MTKRVHPPQVTETRLWKFRAVRRYVKVMRVWADLHAIVFLDRSASFVSHECSGREESNGSNVVGADWYPPSRAKTQPFGRIFICHSEVRSPNAQRRQGSGISRLALRHICTARNAGRFGLASPLRRAPLLVSDCRKPLLAACSSGDPSPRAQDDKQR